MKLAQLHSSVLNEEQLVALTVRCWFQRAYTIAFREITELSKDGESNNYAGWKGGVNTGSLRIRLFKHNLVDSLLIGVIVTSPHK